MKARDLPVILALALLTGCGSLMSPVPVTRISGTLGGQSFSLSSPKDTVATNLSVTVGTNGTAILSIGYIASKQDIAAITNSYAGEQAVVHEVGVQVINGVQAGISAAAAAAK